MSTDLSDRLRSASNFFRSQPKLTEKEIHTRYEFPDATDQVTASPYPFQIDHDNLLSELGAKHQPSKRHHNYLIYYWKHFRDIRLSVTRVLEIGVQTDRSIRMWEEFFPNAIIFGADIDPKCKEYEGGRCKILIGDQGDRNFCRSLVDEAGGHFDIIIDDGSHIVEHQINSFNWLFPSLSEHGIYAMEDTGPVVGDENLKTVSSLRNLVDNIMYWPGGYQPKDWGYLSEFDEAASWADRNIIGVSFYRWIAFVMRGNNPGDNKFLQAGSPPV